MAQTLITRLVNLGLLLGLLILPSTTPAHRLDEYLQATLVSIEPGQVKLQINLTPGVAVAEQVLRLIDRNGDGTISTNEATAYAQSLLQDLAIQVDGRGLPFKLTASTFPTPADLRTGWGVIQVEFSTNFNPLGAGRHTLKLRNRHLPKLSVYLFNAAQPSSARVHITSQKRNQTQSIGQIQFTIDPSSTTAEKATRRASRVCSGRSVVAKPRPNPRAEPIGAPASDPFLYFAQCLLYLIVSSSI